MDSSLSERRALTGLVRRAVLAEGFDAVGIAPAGGIPEAHAFEAWLAAGCHGGMDYLARAPERRADPRRLDPAIRSVVSVGMSCWHPEEAAVGGPPAPRGRIARYARGADYHHLLGRRLRRILARLRVDVPGLDGRWSVDTGPVMDRAWAVRAGLGWWGRHTNVVSRRHGSWLLLGTMLLNREMDCDAPGRDSCGSCRRCTAACPTGAITGDRKLDARLCISYLTIEHRGPIPPALRPLIGNWIFGCDLCLEACPWNRFAAATREARFSAREDRSAPALLPLLSITPEEFRARFNGSPIQRARRDGLVRNVAVALGNVGGAEALEPLARAAAADPSETVREHAAWAGERIRTRAGR